MLNNSNLLLIRYLLLAMSLTALSSCGQKTQIKAHAKLEADVKEGAVLAEKYCVICHEMPSPMQLPKRSWPLMLRNMQDFFIYPERAPKISNMIPADFIYHEKDLALIETYFVNQAPLEEEVRKQLPQFNYLTIPKESVGELPIKVDPKSILLMVNYDNVQQHLFLSEMTTSGNVLRAFDKDYKNYFSEKFPQPIIHVLAEGEGFFATQIGDLDADRDRSAVYKFNSAHLDAGAKPKALLSGLTRTTRITRGDFDADGETDILLVAFGGNTGTGHVSIYWGLGNDQYQEQRLHEESGPMAAIYDDFNGDGEQDFMVLFSQQSQRLLLFQSLAKRKYETKIIIDRPVGWGYMDFVYKDVNKDGLKDIVTVVGNNMELPHPPLKTQHGIYLWLNQGGTVFKEQSFFPMFGATQIAVADFNGDNKIDIAATSIVPDWELDPPLTFVVLLQKKELMFQAYTLSNEQWGRYSVLAAKKEQDNSSIILVRSRLTMGLPQEPSGNLADGLKQPGKIFSIDLNGL